MAERPSRRGPRHEKSINLALQGGGAHGAFTWGVLDRLFEDDRIWIESISGASAGSMNAVVAAQGMYENGAVGARARLETFWRAVSKAAAFSPIRRTPLAMLMGDWSLTTSPSYLAFDLLSRVASPYDVNPLNLNPLRDLLAEQVNFDTVRACTDMAVHVAATNVETGRGKVFSRDEITLDVVMASACLPLLFQAVEIDGAPYWDGGYMGNPPLYPFLDDRLADDIVIVQINPVLREGAPRHAQDILNRLNEITFNSSLLHELRGIEFVNRLLETGALCDPSYRRMNVHVIQARKRMRPLDASSKLNAEWAFLRHLFELGRSAATVWLEKCYDDLGNRSSVDVESMVQGAGASGVRSGRRAAAK